MVIFVERFVLVKACLEVWIWNFLDWPDVLGLEYSTGWTSMLESRWSRNVLVFDSPWSRQRIVGNWHDLQIRWCLICHGDFGVRLVKECIAVLFKWWNRGDLKICWFEICWGWNLVEISTKPGGVDVLLSLEWVSTNALVLKSPALSWWYSGVAFSSWWCIVKLVVNEVVKILITHEK